MLKLSLGAVAEGVKCEQLEKKIVIGNDEVKFFGVQLLPREKEELIGFLRKNIDVFVWSAYEALGVDPEMSIHFSSPKSNHFGAHPKNILMLSRKKLSNLSGLGP